MPNPQQSVDTFERRMKALDLRLAGVSYDMIAKECGYSSKSGAHAAVKSAIEKSITEAGDEVRKQEVARLDRLLLGLWKDATSGDAEAVRAVLKVMQRRANLLGLDAPKRVDQHIRSDPFTEMSDEELMKIASLGVITDSDELASNDIDDSPGDGDDSEEG